ncbi:MAG: hypothetical protein HY331_13830 [Chloroflexi bacterium]|nr:hypothetical protein [Chloroflexota bacterium]
MKTIQTIATVTPDGQLIVPAPPDIPPGEHQVVLVIDERSLPREPRPLLEFPVLDLGPWPANLSLRREDMYDDWGR